MGIEQRLLDRAGDRAGAEGAGSVGPEIGKLHKTILLDDDRAFLGVRAVVRGLDVVEAETRELAEVFGHGDRGAGRRRRVDQQPAGPVDDEPFQGIRSVIALGVDLPGADFPAVGFAVNIDQLPHVGRFLVRNGRRVTVHRKGLGPQHAGHLGGLIKGPLGVVRRPEGPVVDLLVVTLARLELGRGNVEGDGPGTEPEGIEPRIRVVQGGLQAAPGQGDFLQRGDRAAVDDGDARVFRIVILVRQKRIAHHPIEITALEGTGRPFIHPPVARHPSPAVVDAVAQGAPTGRRVVFVTLPIGQREHLLGRARQRTGRIGKLALVKVIDRHRLPQDRHGLNPRRPREVAILEQFVVALNGGEIMAVGIPVTLGEHPLRIGRIHHPVGRAAARLVGNVVVHRIQRLARIDAPGIIPDQTVVNRTDGDPGGLAVITPAQKHQLLFEDARGLAFEGKARGAHFGRHATRIHGDGGIGGVGIGLVAQNHVEIVQVAGGQEERIVRRPIVVARIDADGLGPVQQRFVDFNQAEIVDAGEAERDIAFPALARLGEQADIRADGVAPEVTHPLVEGVDAREHPLHPAFDQLRVRPPRPGDDVLIGAEGQKIALRDLRPIPHREIVIRHHEQRAAQGTRRRAPHGDDVAQGPGGLRPRRASDHDLVGLLGRMQREIDRALRPHIGTRIERHFDLVDRFPEVVFVEDKLELQPALRSRDEPGGGAGRGGGAGHLVGDGRDIVDREGKAGVVIQVGAKHDHRGHAGRAEIHAAAGTQHDARRIRRRHIVDVLDRQLAG